MKKLINFQFQKKEQFLDKDKIFDFSIIFFMNGHTKVLKISLTKHWI